MNPEEAKALLDACTLRPQDASPEARALAAENAELGQWLAHRAAFDESVAAALETMPVAVHPGAGLLQAMNAAAAQSRRPLYAKPAAWMAMAAAIAITGFVAWFMQPEDYNWQTEAMAQVIQVNSGDLPVDLASEDAEELKAALAQAHAPMPQNLPSGLLKLGHLACKVIHVAGKPASVICFEIDDEHEVHLVVMNAASLRNPPPQHQPQFTQRDDWHVASWSDGAQSYMLLTQAAPEKLKALFAAIGPQDHFRVAAGPRDLPKADFLALALR